MGIGPTRDLCEMGNNQNLMVRAKCCERAPHSDCRCSTYSRIDLVEDQHRWTFGEHKSQGQHGSGEFSA
jgi:hypothetical protein